MLTEDVLPMAIGIGLTVLGLVAGVFVVVEVVRVVRELTGTRGGAARRYPRQDITTADPGDTLSLRGRKQGDTGPLFGRGLRRARPVRDMAAFEQPAEELEEDNPAPL